MMPFFVGQDEMSFYDMASIGSSYTVGVFGIDKYPEQVREYVYRAYHNRISPSVFARSGANSWEIKLIKQAQWDAGDLLIFDSGNDNDTDFHRAAAEAFIRNVRNTAPDCKLVYVAFPSVVGGVPTKSAVETRWFAQCTHYGILGVDVATPMAAAIAGGGSIDDYYDAPDYVHPNQAGHDFIAGLINAAVAPSYLDGGQWTPPLPARQYDSEDFEAAPVIVYGTDYDSKTGTWAENDTEISSTTAGSTITFSGTFRSFGAFRTTGINDVTVSIDGGPFLSIPFNSAGHDIGVRSAHTVTIKVVTDCRIDEFWAI